MTKTILIILISLSVQSRANDLFTPEFKHKNIDSVVDKLSDRNSVSLFLAGTLSVLLTQPSDSEVRENWKNNQQMSTAASAAGDFLGTGFASALVIGGQYFYDDNPENWQTHLRALTWQAASVTILKYSFGKQRPGNKNSYVSFPSGHTSTAFATATSLAYTYGWKAALISYPLAAFVGLSRMSDDMHWISDVVGGAFLGIIIGRATYNEKLNEKSNFQFIPNINQGNLQISVNGVF